MKDMNIKVVTFCLGFILLFLFIIWFLKPDHNIESNATTGVETSDAINNPLTLSQNIQTQQKKGLPALTKSLEGTEIDCPIQVDQNHNLVLTRGIRSCFDYFFTMMGEKTESQIISDINQYLQVSLPESAAVYAQALLQKYVAYNKAVFDAQNQNKTKVDNSKAYKIVIDSLTAFQKQYFNDAEIKALFGDENAFNQYNLEKIKINENKQLSATERAEKMSKILDELPPELAEGMKTTEQFTQLQELTKDIQDRGGSPTELRAMREKLVGVDAADRLENVDREELSWKSKIDNYLAQRDQIKNARGDDISKQQKIDVMRQQTFLTKEDQLRSQTYETLHDQKVQKSFHN